jgi:hypothetical protein
MPTESLSNLEQAEIKPSYKSYHKAESQAMEAYQASIALAEKDMNKSRDLAYRVYYSLIPDETHPEKASPQADKAFHDIFDPALEAYLNARVQARHTYFRKLSRYYHNLSHTEVNFEK